MKYDQIKALEDRYQLITYAKFPIALERGSGAKVYDSEGKAYLDFYAGHAVATTGHSHPKLVQSIREQAEQLIFFSNIVYNSTRAKAAQKLVSLLQPEFSRVFLCNSGAEANETALKAARKFTGKTHIIAMQRGFHGRTYGAMSMTGAEKYRAFPPLVPGISFVEFGDLAALDAEIAKVGSDLAAVILEPIQSMAGVLLAAQPYYQGLRERCDQAGALLVYDEVQTGFGRTGRNFFAQTCSVFPDLISCAKGIASGVPMGAVFFTDRIAQTIKLGEHGTTFGGGPLACAAALATLEIIESERLVENAAELGAFLSYELVHAGIPALREVRGSGLLLGVEFSLPVKPLITSLLEHGVIVGSSEQANTLRVIPPLVITREECQLFIRTLQACAAEVF